MDARRFRWIFLALAAFFLAAAFFLEAKFWAAAGFFGCGLLWYWLARRKARELDGPRRP